MNNSAPAPPLVLHVHTLPWVSGSGINTFYSMNFLDSARYRAALACSPGGRLEDLVKEHGIPFYSIRSLCAPIHPIKDLCATVQLFRLYKKTCPAIIHTHNSKAGFLGRLAGRMYGKARIVHTVHGFAFHERETWLRRKVFICAERWAFAWADARVVIAGSLADWAEREGIGTREDYEVVWSGIEVARFADADRSEGRRLLNVGEDVIVIGLVAKLWKGKGHRFILDVLRPMLCDNLKLAFIGEGPLEESLRASASEHVIFTGFLTDTADVTKALDIAVLPSDFEGMGRVLLEAQAAGVPVVANRVGGVEDIVKEGGVLLEPGNTDAWRTELTALVEDPQRRAALGTAGRAFVNENFSARRMVRSLEAIYDRLLRT